MSTPKKRTPRNPPIRKTAVYNAELGQIFYEARKSLRMTQKEFAAHIGGLSEWACWQLERGAHGTTSYDRKWRTISKTVPTVAKYLGVKPSNPITSFDEIYAAAFQAGREFAQAHPTSKVEQHDSLVKKADLAVRVARLLLRIKSGSDETVEDQAVSLMSMTDAALVDTYGRLSMNDEG